MVLNEIIFLLVFSDSRLPNLIVAIAAGMSDIIAPLAAEGYAAEQVTSEPAAHDARAPLRACALESRPCLSFLRTVRALDCNWIPFSVDSRHSLVFLELFSP